MTVGQAAALAQSLWVCLFLCLNLFRAVPATVFVDPPPEGKRILLENLYTKCFQTLFRTVWGGGLCVSVLGPLPHSY